MFTHLLLDRAWLSPAALICMVVLGPLAGRWLHERPATAWGLTALSLVPLAALTLTPVGVLIVRGCTIQRAFPSIGREELANVALFVAPVFLAAIALSRPLVALFAGSVLSAALEAVQAFLPGRACDSNDWVNNTIGALIGAGLAVIALRAAPERARRTPSAVDDDVPRQPH